MRLPIFDMTHLSDADELNSEKGANGSGCDKAKGGYCLMIDIDSVPLFQLRRVKH